VALSLKPNEEMQVAALSAAIVYGIFQLDAPNKADVKASAPGNPVVHGSVKTAVWTSAIVVSAISLLAKAPTVFVVGGLMTVVEGWTYYHANAFDPAQGKAVTTQQSGYSA
jgi:hypothetical protein